MQERARAREEEEEHRRIILPLEENVRVLGVAAVIPERKNPLELIDLTPDSDLNFPMSLDEFRETWRIKYFQDWEFDNYVSNCE
jgi:hypothetical protein